MEKNKMLIDATHPEETRVVAMRNGRVEEFDFESAARKLLRGNIYLAKVTRVEPSLQAAFIDYGGNRHGFLAFNEIHPDYYQIPVADREALKQEEAEAELRAEAEIDERARSRGPRRRRKGGRNERSSGGGQSVPQDAGDDFAATGVETFEDGYSTSGGYDTSSQERLRDDEQDHGGAAVPLRHDDVPGDVRYAASPAIEPDRPLDSAAQDELYRPADAEMMPASASPYSDPHSEADFAPSRDAGWSQSDDTTSRDVGREHHDDDVDHGDDVSEVNGSPDDEQVEQVATDEDALEEVPERPRRRARQYKIQEVIKRRQVMLVQVVKEERGNKGAALTTYISLAGRYTVLMPNTARGGGISRKITQPQDRKRLKAIAEELDVPEGMGLIIRTAGAARTKQEIKRDYEYLLRLWESVRDLTLSSTAPAVVYEEGNIIKRAIRDLYSKEFDQIVVAGDVAHREAQDFMEMLMPGSGGHVASYRGAEPLFARYGIERQLNALFSPYVTLRSGGYIVINQTEALVSVDVNSGKSTREFSIEETAHNTNLEAAEEIARQLKLRDLAGLIVIDFIDMEEKRNNRSVERRLKDSLRHDRARIQVGHISHFGLLEMSRQRLRAGVLEGSTSQCPHCQGTGIIRSIESVSLGVLRGLEDHLIKQVSSISVSTTAEVALYVLNHKRAFITEMERRYGIVVRVEASDRMQGANFAIERISAPIVPVKPAARAAVSMEWGFDRDAEPDEEVDEVPVVASVDDEQDDGGTHEHRGDRDGEERETSGSGEGRGRKRRRRRGRRDRESEPREARASGYDDTQRAPADTEPGHDPERSVHRDAPQAVTGAGGAIGHDDIDDEPEVAGDLAAEGERSERGNGEGGDQPRRGRRRGRRGGRSRRRDGTEGVAPSQAGSLDDADRNEWGVAELAKPGAEQPEFEPAGASAQRFGLVGSVEPAAYGRTRGRHVRSSIVETIGDQSRGDRQFDPSAEAVQLAVRLASPKAVVPPPVRKVETASNELPPARPPVAAVAPPRPAPASAPPAAKAAAGTVSTPAPVAAPRFVPEITFREPASVATPESERPMSVSSIASNSNGGQAAGGHSSPVTTLASPAAAGEHAASAAAEELARPTRRGWWQRRFGGGE